MDIWLYDEGYTYIYIYQLKHIIKCNLYTYIYIYTQCNHNNGLTPMDNSDNTCY